MSNKPVWREHHQNSSLIIAVNSFLCTQVSDPVIILLKEHNARHLATLTALQQQWQDEMFRYSERLLEILSQRLKPAAEDRHTPLPGGHCK
jgi:hypothetical protein